MGKMERNCKRNSIDYNIRIIYCVAIYGGGCKMTREEKIQRYFDENKEKLCIEYEVKHRSKKEDNTTLKEFVELQYMLTVESKFMGDGNIPVGLTDCFKQGLIGNCTNECPNYKRKNCELEDE